MEGSISAQYTFRRQPTPPRYLNVGLSATKPLEAKSGFAGSFDVVILSVRATVGRLPSVDAIELTLSMRSFQVPVTPGIAA
jgi:hypothetical protein